MASRGRVPWKKKVGGNGQGNRKPGKESAGHAPRGTYTQNIRHNAVSSLVPSFSSETYIDRFLDGHSLTDYYRGLC